MLQYHAAMAPKARKMPALGTSEGDATGDIADDVGVAVRRARGGLKRATRGEGSLADRHATLGAPTKFRIRNHARVQVITHTLPTVRDCYLKHS